MPRKAAYKDFVADPELEFEFFLADKLGMTVGRLRDEMSLDEFMRWAIWHAKRAQARELARKTGRGIVDG